MNGEYRGDSDVGKLMHDFNCTDAGVFLGTIIINVILAVVSGVGAYKSLKNFRKSHNLTIYVQTNKALIEIQKMLSRVENIST